MGRVIHFEIIAQQADRAINFYKNVFGWKIANLGDIKYWPATTGEEDEPGINGAIAQSKGRAILVNIIETDNIDNTLDKVRKNGGIVVMEKKEIEGMGTVAYCEDTEGLLFSLLER
jgi:predicted enzyme related to lactoylglutathione lyase